MDGPREDEREDAVAGFAHFARFVSVDPARNRFRCYELRWQPALWGGVLLMRTWERGPAAAELAARRAELLAELAGLAAAPPAGGVS